MGLSQESVGKLIKEASTTKELEEILQAYCMCKLTTGGTSTQVLRKLHLLTLFLKAIDLGNVVVQHYSAFAVTAYTLKTAPETGPVVSPPKTALGTKAWNDARRPSRSFLKRASSSQKLCMPDFAVVRASEVGETEGEATLQLDVEEDRRRIAAGTGIGGWGLLSCPPPYQSQFPHRAPGWELDTLPDYHSVVA